MKYPIPTGEAARLLSVTEPQLAETVRRGKIHPEPEVQAGRRLWHSHHLIQAATVLGILTPDLEEAFQQPGEQEFGKEVRP